MMQRIHLAVTIILIGAIAFLLLRSSNSKIAYVDSAKLLNEYDRMKDAKKDYSKKAAGWQASIDTLSNDVKKSVQAYERLLAAGSDNEKRMAKELIIVKQKQLADYQKYLQRTAQSEDVKQTGILLKSVNEFLYNYGIEHGYAFIFITGSSVNIAYAKPEFDITSEVVKALNNEYHAQ